MTATLASIDNINEANKRHRLMANALRFLAMDAVEKARSGHPGMPMGMADVATVLFQHFLTFDPTQPQWPNRDRFVLSAGHGSMLLYALLYLTGYEDMTLDELKNFRQLGSRTAGHPEYGDAPGIEVTTGPLGQGFANSVGMALAERLLAKEFGQDLVDHYTYVIASDGDLMEGISHEAASFAGHLRLNKLIVFYDDNHISIDGSTELAFSDDTVKRFEGYHWFVQRVDGHNPEEIYAAIVRAKQSDLPSLIACRTTIAYGAPTKAGTAASHGAPLGVEEIAATRVTLGWPYPAFVIPDGVLTYWRALGTKEGYKNWEERFENHPQRDAIARRLKGELPQGWEKSLQILKQQLVAEKPYKATRVLSQQVLDVLAMEIPELLGGSADLTGSNNTKAKSQQEIKPGQYLGKYIHYGVREHAMAGIMNGIAVHQGFIPYGGTFLIFSDYLRPSLRLSALMKLRVIYVLTHDSIGLGEDGPTHQPIEHLASLRAIPNLNVFRPADGVEVAECWELALKSKSTPSALILTRQSVKHARSDIAENWSARGAYIVRGAEGDRQVTLLATGSEVGVALDVQQILAVEGVALSVVSMPCWRLFDQQTKDYRDQVLGPDTSLKVAIEAASPLGWERYVGTGGMIFAIDSFGASAPYQDIYKHFGLTAEKISEAILSRLKEKK